MENTDKLAALNAIKSKFTSTIIKIYINSLQKEVCFREITVAEQKKLARIMIDNESRKDIVYDTQCAILKNICLDKDIDIYSLLEFDKIKLLLMLYQRNMNKHEITFICPECQTENKYKINFQNAIKKLDSFDISDKTFNYENDNWNFTFEIGYPTIDKVSKFYQTRYLNVKRNTNKNALESLNTSINVDYINLFIKSMSFVDKTTNQKTDIDFNDYTIDQMIEIVSVLPQDVLYSDTGTISYITNEFISKINDVFDKHTCCVCGKEISNLSDSSANGFL